MRTNVVLDDKVLSKAIKVSGLSTKKAVINEALREYVRNHSRLDIRELRGKIHIDDDYDYKSLRK